MLFETIASSGIPLKSQSETATNKFWLTFCTRKLTCNAVLCPQDLLNKTHVLAWTACKFSGRVYAQLMPSVCCLQGSVMILHPGQSFMCFVR